VSRKCPESHNETRPSTQKARLWTKTPKTRTDNTGDPKKKGDLIETYKIMTAKRSYPVNSFSTSPPLDTKPKATA